MSTTHRQIVQTGIVTENFGSTMTRVNHIDTYQCFPLGDTECPDEPTELQQVAYKLAAAGLADDDEGWDGLDEDVAAVWVDRGPYGASAESQFWEVTYDHTGWLTELARASVAVLQDRVVDPAGIIRAVEFTAQTWSPQFYNFTTDGYMARWTVDTDTLEVWLDENGITIDDGRGISGFIRTADDEAWYLARALQEYLEAEIGDYFSAMLDYLSGNGVEDEYVDVTITDAGRAWLAEHATN